MKADKLGVLSALLASVCCVTPLVLVLVGLGSLGVGAALGRFHWWFLLAASGLLAYGWWVYVKEQGRCRTANCEMPRNKTTQTVLTAVSVVVAAFVGLNLYTYAGQRTATVSPPTNKELASVVLPVEGMTCLTCELTIESSLRRLPGVTSADASVAQQAVAVSYDPAQVTLDGLIATVNKTGYKVNRPSTSPGGAGGND